jgi:hypothetical protein
MNWTTHTSRRIPMARRLPRAGVVMAASQRDWTVRSSFSGD